MRDKHSETWQRGDRLPFRHLGSRAELYCSRRQSEAAGQKGGPGTGFPRIWNTRGQTVTLDRKDRDATDRTPPCTGPTGQIVSPSGPSRFPRTICGHAELQARSCPERSPCRDRAGRPGVPLPAQERERTEGLAVLGQQDPAASGMYREAQPVSAGSSRPWVLPPAPAARAARSTTAAAAETLKGLSD
ncbi:hypothetical protein TREES_T100006418 [Tupaia chinensis]|uniref:Uncharacterized protein n=1 Tax=Tupaia chinensis TaxID=246437 RepID=L9KW08_TUPCH|nr:hypothetical protein TREES_T100006418 [Tupaia chinensis]